MKKTQKYVANKYLYIKENSEAKNEITNSNVNTSTKENNRDNEELDYAKLLEDKYGNSRVACMNFVNYKDSKLN